jgi:hypothetical protein
MFPTLPPFEADTTVTPATIEVVGEPMPDLSDLTMGVIDLSDTGFVTDDPAVLIWLAAVNERGLAW